MFRNSKRNRRWRRWILRIATVLFMLVASLAALILSRFYFSNQDFPMLASWQGNDRMLVTRLYTRPQIIGHRGSGLPASRGGVRLRRDGKILKEDDLPLLIGNTASAIQLGIEAGADWIEVDLRVSKDDKLIVFHDESLISKTNFADERGESKIRNLNQEALQKIRLLVEPPENILTLDDVFSRFQSKDRQWVFDIKATGMQREVLDWIQAKVSTGELAGEKLVLFGSYNVLSDYKESGYKLGYIVNWGHEEGLRNRFRVLFTPSQIINRCESLGCELLVLPTIFAKRSLVDAAASKGIEVWVYGSDDEVDLNYFAGIGVKGLIVDDPKRTVKHFVKQSLGGS